MNNSPLQRPTGTQPTVYDQEVDLAAERQQLAPSAAAPPLLVKSLEPVNSRMLVGAPMPNGVHQRASPAVKVVPSYPEADAFARNETQRRLQLGGFYDTPHGTEILYAVPNATPTAYHGQSEWQPRLPQVPVGMRTEMHAAGLSFERSPPMQTNNASQQQMAGNTNSRVAAGNANQSNKVPNMTAANMLAQNGQVTNAAYANGNAPVLRANGMNDGRVNGGRPPYNGADPTPLGANIFGNASPAPFNAGGSVPTQSNAVQKSYQEPMNGNGFTVSQGNKSYISSFLNSANVGAAPVLSNGQNSNLSLAMAQVSSNNEFNAGNTVNSRRNGNRVIIANTMTNNGRNVMMANANDAIMSNSKVNSNVANANANMLANNAATNALANSGINVLQNSGSASMNANGLVMTTNTASFNVANANMNMPLNSRTSANMQQNVSNGNSRMYANA